jgi:hypothetical protein
MWGASEGLPEHWKAEVRGKLGGIKGPEDTGYWSVGEKLTGVTNVTGKRKRGEQGFEEAEVGELRRSDRFKRNSTGLKQVTLASELDD